jgi:hypothetical protein
MHTSSARTRAGRTSTSRPSAMIRTVRTTTPIRTIQRTTRMMPRTRTKTIRTRMRTRMTEARMRTALVGFGAPASAITARKNPMSSFTDPLHGFAASSSTRIWRKKKHNSATKLIFPSKKKNILLNVAPISFFLSSGSKCYCVTVHLVCKYDCMFFFQNLIS